MATVSKRRSENVSGNFYVDSSCIDCETCRILAPEVFSESGGASYVQKQPSNETESLEALRALLSCPTASIGTQDRADLQKAKQSFPSLIQENVYHCGYHSRASFGAFSYLIVRDSGNVLIDSPRFVPSLAEKIRSLGGVRYHYLTHRDDIADHAKFREEFHCDRIIHEEDADAVGQPEIILKGKENYRLDEDLLIIPTPGHTRGHSVLLYADQFLFTGDHLAFDPERERLIAFRNACWYSWPEQKKSMQSLTNIEFEWVLPGHGHPFQASKERMHEMLLKCIEWM
ncbi:4Fe-4S single cluster domain protein [Leptospira broomii serovar Hurstbridge str. 5399]|uniref:4Fe-4S single cluster domain protein n=1 Tax=Leptospira broomii serovar Hurstbridge str. 5399 TaxID=1049789 RepID=T0F8E6_9LEPT|nr:MBL fold metallo-hydrolase [Leptospira broomii]EQA43782.1 4Fe-4S single cluster domain protein [Leptospira broomii serovar Hurstbridge str. 5399]